MLMHRGPVLSLMHNQQLTNIPPPMILPSLTLSNSCVMLRSIFKKMKLRIKALCLQLQLPWRSICFAYKGKSSGSSMQIAHGSNRSARPIRNQCPNTQQSDNKLHAHKRNPLQTTKDAKAMTLAQFCSFPLF